MFLVTKTETGLVEGLPAGNQAIAVFKGIPYAKAPEGELRWRLPQPAEPWEGVRECYKFGKICYQEWMPEGSFYRKEFWPRPLEMSEDCLHLNIWTPAENVDDRYPVAVWFHGGGLRQGFAHKLEIDGENFAQKGCVFVGVNYRLNMFGFMGHPELTAEAEAETGHKTSGNYGILDQIFALQWIKRNIANFGGDPDKVTIFGQSGGGRSVWTMSCSPLAKGLFRGAIMQSGGGMSRVNFNLEDSEQMGIRFLEYLGCKNIAEARQVPGQELREACDRMVREKGLRPMFAPNHDEYLMPESYDDIMFGGKFNDVNYMIGSNYDDMGGPPADREREIAQAKELYGDRADEYLKTCCIDDPEKFAELSKRFGPERMQAQAIGWVQLLNKCGRKPGYVYCFEQVPPGGDGVGAFHAAEHMYLHMTLNRSWRPYTGADYEFAQRISSYWTNFIKTGDPNGEGLAQWDPYTEDNPKIMHLQGECHQADVEMSPRLKFITDFNMGK